MEEEKKEPPTDKAESGKEDVADSTTDEKPVIEPKEGTEPSTNGEVESDKKDETSPEIGMVNNRPIVVELRDRKVYVNTLDISMSFRFRMGMLCSFLSMIGFGAITTYVTMANAVPWPSWIVGCIGGFCEFLVVSIAIINLQNWVSTMNKYNRKMGEWAMEDVIGICQDFISAGLQFAAEEVEKAKGGEGKESAPEEQKS